MTDIQSSLTVMAANIDASNYVTSGQKIVQTNEAITRSGAAVETQETRTNNAVAASERAFQRLEKTAGGAARAYLDMVKAEEQYARAQDLVNRNLTAGYGNQERATRILTSHQQRVAAAREAYDKFGKGVDDTNKKLQLSAGQLQVMSYQVNDVVGGIIQGQKPFMILAQQGPQIVQGFGGVAATMGFIKQAISSLNPVVAAGTLAFAALFGGLTVGISRSVELDKNLRQLRQTLQATGNNTASASALQSQVYSFAEQPGVSRDTAMASAQGILSNPLISGDMFKRALPLARDFAAATGKDIPAAAKLMADALVGGLKAAKGLDDQFNILSVSQLQQIKNFEQQGNTAASAAIVLQALERRFAGLADIGVTPLEKATNDLGNAWDKLLDRLGRSGPIEAAKRGLLNLINTASGQASGGTSFMTIAALAGNPLTIGLAGPLAALNYFNTPASGTTVQDIEQQLAAAQARQGGTRQAYGRQSTGNSATVQQLQQQLYGALGTMFEGSPVVGDGTDANGNLSRTAAELDALGKSAQNVAEQFDPVGTEMRRLEAEQIKLTNAMLNGRMEADAYAVAFANVGKAIANLPSPDQQLADLRGEVAAKAKGPQAHQEYLARRTLERSPGWTPEQVDEGAKLRGKLTTAGGGFNLGQTISGITQEVSASQAVVDAYGQSTEAGRKAELQLKAITSQHKLGAAAVQQYADALYKEDQAKRAIEGAKELRKLSDDVADQKQLTAALEESTIAYDKMKIAIEAQRKVSEGKLTPSQAVDYQAKSLENLQNQYAQEAIRLNRQYDPIAQYNDTITKLNELAKTGKLSAKAYAEAWRDAEIQRRQASDSAVDGMIAGLLQYQKTAQQVASSVAQLTVQTFGQLEDTIARLSLGMKVNFKQMFQDLQLEVMKLVVRTSITGPLASSMLSFAGITPNAAATGGLNGYASPMMGLGGFAGAGGGGGGLLGSFGGGGGLGGGFGGGSLFGFDMSAPLFGGFQGISAGAMNGVIPGMSGADSLSYFAGLSGAPTLSAGSLLGGVGSIGMGALNLAQGNTIGGVSGILGGGLGLLGAAVPALGFLGPIGMGIGLIGGLLGGLLGKKKVQTPQEVTNIGVGDNGMLEVLDTITRANGTGTTKKATSGITRTVNELLRTNDLSFGSGLTGGYLLNSKGKNTGDQYIYGEGLYGGSRGTGFGAKEIEDGLGGDEAVGKLIASFFLRAASSGNLLGSGATATVKAIFSNAFNGIGDAVIESAEDVSDALSFAKVYDKIKAGDVQTESEGVVQGIIDNFKAALVKAQEYGLDTSFFAGAQQKQLQDVVTGFNDKFRRGILGMTPEGARDVQLEDLDKAKTQDLAEAKYLIDHVEGALVDINQIEEYYAKQRAKIIEDYNEQATSTLKALYQSLQYGDLSGVSAAATLEGTKATYQATYAQAAAGDSSALARIAGEATDYINAQTAATGNDPRREAVRQQLLNDINSLIAANGGALPGSAANGNQTTQQQIITNQQMQIDANDARFAQLMDRMESLERVIRLYTVGQQQPQQAA